MGTITINILDAKNLPGLDSSGTSDPYIIIYLDGIKIFRTKTVKRDINPSFQESFNVTVVCLFLLSSGGIFRLQGGLEIIKKISDNF